MKTPTTITAILLLSTLGALAQGIVNFSTRVSGTVVAHVYGFVCSEAPKTGNTASETPAGVQTYAGAWLAGTGFSASLWAANGSGQPEGSLTLVPGSLTSFRTGATLGGTPFPLTLAVPGIPAGGTGTFQIRAWNNLGGTITSYGQALFSPTVVGKSVLFDVSGLGDGVLTLPADFANFRSFNLYLLDCPEPSTYALLGFGALGLWIFRRKKHTR